MLPEFHDSAIGGHSGFLRTYKRVAHNLFWQGMKEDIRQYVAKCSICQRSKYEAMTPSGLLQPLPISERVWEDITMDFIGGLPRSQGVDTILVVVDQLSKYAHFLSLSHPFMAKKVAELFVCEIVRLHGIPCSIVTDRDLSLFWRELFRMQGTKLNRSSAYHPEYDCQTEVVNRGLEVYVCCFASDQPHLWLHHLPWAVFWFNTNYNVSTRHSPFHVLYDRDPPTVHRFQDSPSTVEDVNLQLQQRNEFLDILRGNLVLA